MNIVAIYWKDVTEHKDCLSSYEDSDPLVYLVSIGIRLDERIDKDGMKYTRLVYKKALDETANDDCIDIPTALIIKVEELSAL